MTWVSSFFKICTSSFAIISYIIILLNCSCKKANKSIDESRSFISIPEKFMLTPDIINEASGIADSKNNPGFLWVEEDGDNPPELTLVSHQGVVQKKIAIRGATNRDWEDITLSSGPEPGKNYIYLADIGDNGLTYGLYTIYRFEEPMSVMDTVELFDKIQFSYPDGSHDAEALIVDHQTKDIYIITKRDVQSQIFKLTYPQSTSLENKAVLAGKLNYNGVVSAAIAPDGKGIVLKTYQEIHFFPRNTNESIEKSLQRTFTNLPYLQEPKGEAICFGNANGGYFTLSERGFTSVSLHFYKKK